MLKRRGFLAGLATALAAPAIVRTPGLLMAVKPLPPVSETFTYTWVSYGGSFGRIEGWYAGPESALLEARMRDAYEATKQNIARVLYSETPTGGLVDFWDGADWEEMLA